MANRFTNGRPKIGQQLAKLWANNLIASSALSIAALSLR